MKWLLQTVGGSCQPLVTALNTLNPERVVFLCSGGPRGSCHRIQDGGKVCEIDGHLLPNVPTQVGLTPHQYELSVYDMDPDDLSTAYSAIVDTIRRIRREDPEAKLWCDYTGGTKTMSAALAMAAVDEGDTRIMLVAGSRPDLVKVEDGTQFLTPAHTESVLVHRLSREVDQLWSHFEYAAAERILRAFLSATGQTAVAGWLSACLGFDAWDRFDHASALRHLKAPKADSLAPCLAFLGPLAHARGEAWESPVGYRFVSDLLANAERRAAQGRYDDAVARHYRAIELFIQTWLWNVNAIDTRGIREDQVPNSVEWKGQVEEWPLRPGLIRAWDLAAVFDAKISELWRVKKGAVLHATERRNFSILAHGCRPIDVSGYDADRAVGLGYLTREALDLVCPNSPEVPPFAVSVSACERDSNSGVCVIVDDGRPPG